MTKPCLPYTGQYKINMERTAELYPKDRGFITIAAVGNRLDFKPREQRPDLGEK